MRPAVTSSCTRKGAPLEPFVCTVKPFLRCGLRFVSGDGQTITCTSRAQKTGRRLQYVSSQTCVCPYRRLTSHASILFGHVGCGRTAREGANFSPSVPCHQSLHLWTTEDFPGVPLFQTRQGPTAHTLVGHVSDVACKASKIASVPLISSRKRLGGNPAWRILRTVSLMFPGWRTMSLGTSANAFARHFTSSRTSCGAPRPASTVANVAVLCNICR